MTQPLVPARYDLALVEGYHSPQVQVDVRLNTNESPFAIPDALRDTIREIDRTIAWNRYPDREATALRAALARLEKTHTENVWVGNGSNEILQMLLLAYGGPGRTALVFEPTYALHTHIAKITGTGTVVAWRDENYVLQPDAVATTIRASSPNLVFLCSPNNPTGVADSPAVVAAALAACKDVSALLVIDEAYGQFAEHSNVGRLDEQTPLVVTRTFSKTWAMAGLRLGYIVAPTWVIAALKGVTLPYHLDAAKQAIGEHALEYENEMRNHVAELVAQRTRLETALNELGVRTWPSQANFILFDPTGKDANIIWQSLVNKSVLVRNCAGWPGLSNCLRVTVGTVEENTLFLTALAAALGEEQ